MQEHILFLNMFSAVRPDESACDYFSQAQILSADVDAQRRWISVQVFSPVYIPGRVVQAVRQQVIAVYGLAGLELTMKHPQSALSSMEGDDLMALFVAENSMCRGSLAGAQWQWEGEKLTVKLRANGKKVLQECVPAVKRGIFEMFDTQVQIEIEAAENLDRQALFEAMEKMRYSILSDLPKTAETAAKQEQAAPAQDTIFGKPFKGKAIPMEELTLDMGFVIVEGKVFHVEHKELSKRNAWVINFDITDHTSSIRVSRFLENKDAKPILEGISEGAVVKVQGKLLIDNYTNELTLRPNAICPALCLSARIWHREKSEWSCTCIR